jgi:predicted phage terminase large subunit-like protein
MNDLSHRELLHLVYKSDFHSFLQRAFSIMEPGHELKLMTYLELTCAVLTQVEARAIKRLIINMPPRHLKSFVTSVVFPAWLLMRDPSLKIAVISHSDMLANDLAGKCMRLIESDDYRDIAPSVQIRSDRHRRTDFETTRGGGVFSASIASGITGRGFDHIILDDPISAKDAMSEAERERVQLTYEGMISSRLDDPVRGTIIVVQQRLHEADLSGHLLAKGGWEHLCLPLVAEEDKTHKFGACEWHRPKGDILLPDRFPREEIEKIRAHEGETIFATQWQQNPSSTKGELIKAEYLRPFDHAPPTATRLFMAVDTAVKQTSSSDYTVFLTIATDGFRHYVMDVHRGRWDQVQMRDVAISLRQRYLYEKILIEDSASGPGLQTTLAEKGIKSDTINVSGRGKEERLQRHLHAFVAGRIYVRNNQPWTVEFRNEFVRFPVGRYDDQVDAMTLYLDFIFSYNPHPPTLLGTNSCADRLAAALGPKPSRKGEHHMRPRHPGPRALPWPRR